METNLTTLRPLTFYARLTQPDDRCDGLGPQRTFPEGTIVDVLRGNPYRLALCSTVAEGREWYIWTRADDFNARETDDADSLYFPADPTAPPLDLSAVLA